ncbi:uncharacterized protein LOC144178971 isoform X1 [Haemaphysalis longicornis]
MTGNYFFEGLRTKRPMAHAWLVLLVIAATVSAIPRQAPEEPRVERLEQEAETTTEHDAGYIVGRIVGGKPVSVLRKREHGGAASNRTSSAAARPGMRGSGAGLSMPARDVHMPRFTTTARPYSEDGLRPDSSSWSPSSTGSVAKAQNSRPNQSSGNSPSQSGGGSSMGRPSAPSDRPRPNVPNEPREPNGFDDDHRVGFPNRNSNNGDSVPWNHQGVSPYPTPVTAAHTDNDSPGYNPNQSATPHSHGPSPTQNPAQSSNPNNVPGRIQGGIIIGHPPVVASPQQGTGTNYPPSNPRQSNAPRVGGGIIIGSPPTNALGGHPGGFQNSMPLPEGQGRRGVVNYPPQPSQGAGSFGLPSIPNNPFAPPGNHGFPGPGNLPLPFGAGLFNPGLVNIQKAVENAAAGVLGATGAGPNPAGADVFGRTSSFGQMSSYGFSDRK